MLVILLPLDFANLASNGLVVPGTIEGTVRLHKRRLNSWSDEENQHLSLDSTSSDASDDGIFSTIPEELISPAALVFVGFTHQKAEELWAIWPDWPTDVTLKPARDIDPTKDFGLLVAAFMDLMDCRLDVRPEDEPETLDEWEATLQRLGLSDEAREAILDPHFEYLRQSESCKFWAKDTARMRFAALSDIKRASMEREKVLRRESSRSGPSGSSSASRGQPASSTVLIRPVPRDLLDHTGAIARLSPVGSFPPTDFTGTRRFFYFATDYSTAEYYASFAKRRPEGGAVVILHVTIPNCEIKRLGDSEKLRVTWPSDEWKQLIWGSRRGGKPRSQLTKYQDATLIIGTMSRKPKFRYEELGSWEEITEEYVFMSGRVRDDRTRTPLTQYAFSSDAGEYFLEEHAEITMEPFTGPRLGAWLRHLAAQTGELGFVARESACPAPGSLGSDDVLFNSFIDKKLPQGCNLVVKVGTSIVGRIPSKEMDSSDPAALKPPISL
ncbi:hypothetical protein GMORB2_7681 [Geosmithia morbida]|uniref:Uncharacterized protein n=1 Tax=Geosmithia morbida TaxID=1094350 RepID=A0A9P5CZX1_9HYPO|nr:uncharacterized protein GMORB2_7681 [Geosmithia morbida]KAF4122088.1 hypothetical protein GMORB2_7681 [Geosmithia morbida]